LGANIESVRHGIGSDPRIGYQFLYPGAGYGGSCFPKDVRALQSTARDNGIALKLLHAVEEVNESQKHVLVDKVLARLDGNIEGRRFAVWGLAFKPDTDDMREAPSRVIIDSLVQRGAAVVAYDPVAMNEGRRIYKDAAHISFAPSPLDACDGADALVIVTEWKEFRGQDLEAVRARLKHPLLFDGRNLYDPAFARAAGIEYFSIGRP
jgi:UDPglucose 6-dehydrogenase